MLAHLPFLLLGTFECALQRLPDRLDLSRQLVIDLPDLVFQLYHQGIARLEGLQLLLIIRHQTVALCAQSINDAIRQQLRQIDRVSLVNLLPELLVLDPVGHQITKGNVRRRKIVLRDRRLVADDDDLFLLREINDNFL